MQFTAEYRRPRALGKAVCFAMAAASSGPRTLGVARGARTLDSNLDLGVDLQMTSLKDWIGIRPEA